MTCWEIPEAVVPAEAGHHPAVLPLAEDPHREVRLAVDPVQAAMSEVLAAVAILVDPVVETGIAMTVDQPEVLTTDLPASKARVSDVVEADRLRTDPTAIATTGAHEVRIGATKSRFESRSGSKHGTKTEYVKHADTEKDITTIAMHGATRTSGTDTIASATIPETA